MFCHTDIIVFMMVAQKAQKTQKLIALERSDCQKEDT